MQELVAEYGLHAQIGEPERWESIPSVRSELVGLKIADVRGLKLPQGSFELICWHDALTRALSRIAEQIDRWEQDTHHRTLPRRVSAADTLTGNDARTGLRELASTWAPT